MAKETYYRARRRGFTTVENEILDDPNIKLEGKGLMAVLLSNSETWKINMKNIISRSKNGRDAHYSIIWHLIEHGYYARIYIREDGKHKEVKHIFGGVREDVKLDMEDFVKEAEGEGYLVTVEYLMKKQTKKKNKEKEPHTENQDTVEKQPEKPLPENQDTDNQDTESPYTVNQYINNLKGNKTKTNNTNSNKTNDSSSSSIEEPQLEDRKKLQKKKKKMKQNLMYLGYELAHEKIMRTNKQINETIELMAQRGIIDFDYQDVEKAITHYKKECVKRDIGNPPIFFVNGFELKLNERYSSQLGDNFANEIKIKKENRKQLIGDLYYNWLEE